MEKARTGDANRTPRSIASLSQFPNSEIIDHFYLAEESMIERSVERNTLTTAPYSNNMLMTSDFTTTVLVNGHPDIDSDFDEFSDGEAPASSCNSSSSSTSR